MVCLAAVAALAVVAACGDSDETPAPFRSDPTVTPRTRATIDALAGVARGGTPTPTTVPLADKKAVEEFAKGHRTVVREWDAFHSDFDIWREGLTPCDSSSLQVILRQFAATMNGITEEARALPRSRSVRGLADKLIDSVEAEEQAVRLLRDSVQPDDPTVFEEVDVQRSEASALQKEVQDALTDLEEMTAPETRALVKSFSSAFERVNSRWDQFHSKYDAFRAQEAELTSADTVARLSELIDELRGIAAVHDLGASEITRPVSQVLAEAADNEDLALRKLRGTFQKSEEVDEETADSSIEEVSFTVLDPTLFDAFDAEVVNSNSLRRQASQGLADLVEETSKTSQDDVEKFKRRYDRLFQSWDEFHMEYDDWRQSEGGCDRSQALETLGDFALRFEELSGDVRELPRAIFLRPLGELLVEAAERERSAVWDLRDTWRPFDPGVYDSFDREREVAGKLRRQVAAGLEELVHRYRVSS